MHYRHLCNKEWNHALCQRKRRDVFSTATRTANAALPFLCANTRDPAGAVRAAKPLLADATTLTASPAPSGCSSSLSSSCRALATCGFVSVSNGLGAFHASRVCLRPDRKGPPTRLELADALGTETFTQVGTKPLDLNLFEDPTAGLASGPAEELTAAEIEAQVRLLAASYDRSIFYLLYTSFVDVVQLMAEAGLLPQSSELRADSAAISRGSGGGGRSGGVGDEQDAASGGSAGRRKADSEDGAATNKDEKAVRSAGSRSTSQSAASTAAGGPRRREEVMTRWFSDGLAVIKDPHGTTAAVMGERRWSLLRDALDVFYAPIEDVMPLTRAVRKHRLPEHLYVPFLRQLSMSLVPPESRRATVALLPGLILGLANGRAPGVLELPDDHAERVLLVAELFLGAAQETGNTDLAYLGIQLLRANDIMTPFRFQKQLTNVFSTAARLQTDWLARSTGQIADVFPRWQDYQRKVRHDNVVQLCKLQDATEGKGDGGGVSREGSAEGLWKSETSTKTSTGKDLEEGSHADSTSKGAVHHEQQHEYFTSRRSADVARVSALEQNIAEALRSREASLASSVAALTQRRRQRQLKRQAQQQQQRLKEGGLDALSSTAGVPAAAHRSGSTPAKAGKKDGPALVSPGAAEETAHQLDTTGNAQRARPRTSRKQKSKDTEPDAMEVFDL